MSASRTLLPVEVLAAGGSPGPSCHHHSSALAWPLPHLALCPSFWFSPPFYATLLSTALVCITMAWCSSVCEHPVLLFPANPSSAVLDGWTQLSSPGWETLHTWNRPGAWLRVATVPCTAQWYWELHAASDVLQTLEKSKLSKSLSIFQRHLHCGKHLAGFRNTHY